MTRRRTIPTVVALPPEPRSISASNKLADIDKEIATHRAKVTELIGQRRAVEKEQRQEANKVVLANVEALLCFASHSFKDCEDAKPYKNPNCPRCALLTAKEDGYISDDMSFTVNVGMEQHDTD